MWYDHTNPNDPFHNNRPITAVFDGFTGWKNGRNGAIAGKIGDVRLKNFRVADNILAGIEVEQVVSHNYQARVEDALIIGRTNNTDDKLDMSSPRGLITPRTDNFLVDGIKFYNMNWNQASGIGSCSHCFHDAATDSGSRTVYFKNINWGDTAVKFGWQTPFRAIYHDLDGTLTGKGAGSWATPWYNHHNWTECEYMPNNLPAGGAFCDSTIQIRRIAFTGYAPSAMFRGMGIKLLRYDDDMWLENGGGHNKTEFIDDKSKYSSFGWKNKLDPADGWAVPFVTGHKYKIHWGQVGIDFEQMQLYMSEYWNATDKDIYFVHNFTDVRAAFDLQVQSNGTWMMPNNSIPANSVDWTNG